MSESTALPSGPVAFIGGGNMARSLIGGLVARGFAPAKIRVAEPVEALRTDLQRDFGVACFDNAQAAAEGAALWLLAVKPQVMREVCAALAAQARAQRPLAISIAAGITAGQLDRWLGGEVAVVRAMPNTPALLGAGITGLYANAAAKSRFEQAAGLLAAVGPTVRIDDEAQMDAVTAVSGSGPAYVFLLAEAMQQAGVAQGLSAEAARALVQQTLFGAATMLTRSEEPAEVLRARVTSPGGTTQAAIETFEAGGFRALVDRAIAAATERGRQLSAANE
ncbi:MULTISPECIES: pyrroline-5-carboxylate reductase [unclassified Lysobacter]|uniref:pyrroline-5-carboxylate reductase n=1 Tax=unclassified Lysobacter TaxID=2635362 RepID=UPI001BEA14A0|nr:MULTISPECIES: pyrroline-5-carboxylate reductase [unclassified Lysobacter]MBT2745138.1 pyrroline-5-carboxylate reductase [Lysobacter sp. ISL-42]MBT2750935.1 pyrroline-5-carboxylate reductase [Lysobacter sp. ISL-50]MBT2778002.1 pyrroline-5-carboxylate reductase [Lysobacter sp. ISL-54]MBT2783940.1 pyrroline-5-carboxylate reductase [Lysobacter sp. ISL-52]